MIRGIREITVLLTILSFFAAEGFAADIGSVILSGSVNGGNAKFGQRLIIYPNMDDTDIYYTLDGSEPSCESIRYTGTGIDLFSEEAVHIKAVGYNEGIKGITSDFGRYVADKAEGLLFAPTIIEEDGQIIFTIINTESEKDIFVAAAAYRDGILSQVKGKKVRCFAGENGFELKLDSIEGATVKAFVWSGGTMTPLSGNEVYKSSDCAYKGGALPRRIIKAPIYAFPEGGAESDAVKAEKLISGSTDAEIQAAAAYNNEELILRLQIKDATASESDFVTVYIDAYNDKHAYYDDNDFIVRIKRSGAVISDDISIICTEEENGWSCELYIPFGDIYSGRIIGFDFAYDDYGENNEFKGRRIWRGSENNSSSTNAFGELVIN